LVLSHLRNRFFAHSFFYVRELLKAIRKFFWDKTYFIASGSLRESEPLELMDGW